MSKKRFPVPFADLNAYFGSCIGHNSLKMFGYGTLSFQKDSVSRGFLT